MPWTLRSAETELRRLQTLIVATVWPLLEPKLGGLQARLVAYKDQAERMWGLYQLLDARVTWLEVQASGSPSAATPVFLNSTAKGAIRRGDPVMFAAGFPDHVSVITADEPGVSAFLGFSSQDAPDEAPVQVWTSGACPLFAGLNVTPTPPDTAEVFVYGPYPPVFASGLASGSFAKRAGIVLDSTTVLLGLGEVFKAA